MTIFLSILGIIFTIVFLIVSLLDWIHDENFKTMLLPTTGYVVVARELREKVGYAVRERKLFFLFGQYVHARYQGGMGSHLFSKCNSEDYCFTDNLDKALELRNNMPKYKRRRNKKEVIVNDKGLIKLVE